LNSFYPFYRKQTAIGITSALAFCTRRAMSTLSQSAGHSAAELAEIRSPVTHDWQCYKDAIATFQVPFNRSLKRTQSFSIDLKTSQMMLCAELVHAHERVWHAPWSHVGQHVS
jgi:hypothetical protein